MKSLTVLFSIVFALIANNWQLNAIPLFPPACPQQCSCNYTTANELEIACGALTNIVLPESTNSPLQSTVSIIIKNTNLQTYPTNLCSYSLTLQSLDLSSNSINVGVPSSLLSCLTNLKYLFLYNNKIPSLDADAFRLNKNLNTIDLSYNLITSLPTNLFTYNMSKLLTLKINNNLLTTLDAWYFYLPNINSLDLSFNQISSFTNQIEFSLYKQASFPIIPKWTVFNLQSNQIQTFDDSLLKLYGVCDSTSLKYLLRFLYPLNLANNNLICNCVNSYNLLKFSSILISQNSLDLSQTLFKAKCQSPAQYSGQSMINFDNPATNTAGCSAGVSFSSSNCPIQTSTGGTENLIAAPKIPLESKAQPSLYAAQIAGIVLGLLGFLCLFLILLYCICPIEILAACFTCVPFFYSLCPCKSGVKRDKEYDLFISYNKSNVKWVKNKLIPFIHEKCLVESYILHYNTENRQQEVFGPYIKDIMNRSSCILFVLSDAFLMKEWNNKEFRLHLRYLISKERTRFICVQLHDVCDEEVEEYFTEKLQIPRFVSLEDDEFLFWMKLGYHLYTNDSDQRIMPVKKYIAEEPYKPNDDLEFDPFNIHRPIIHLPAHPDPESRNRPPIQKSKKHKRLIETFKTTLIGKSGRKDKKLIQEIYTASRSTTPISNSRRPSRVDVNLEQRWDVADNNRQFGMRHVTASSETPTNSYKKTISYSTSPNYNYSIKKNSNNLEINMPYAHEVYTSHQVQNKTVSMQSIRDQYDSNESSI